MKLVVFTLLVTASYAAHAHTRSSSSSDSEDNFRSESDQENQSAHYSVSRAAASSSSSFSSENLSSESNCDSQQTSTLNSTFEDQCIDLAFLQQYLANQKQLHRHANDGWTVCTRIGPSRFGEARFLLEPVKKDQILRRNVVGKNMICLRSVSDVEAWGLNNNVGLKACETFGWSPPESCSLGPEHDNDVYISVPGFYINTSATERNVCDSVEFDEELQTFIPVVKAFRNMNVGEELIDDYSLYTKRPWWDVYLQSQGAQSLNQLGHTVVQAHEEGQNDTKHLEVKTLREVSLKEADTPNFDQQSTTDHSSSDVHSKSSGNLSPSSEYSRKL